MNKVLWCKYSLLFLFLLTSGITIYSKFIAPLPVYEMPASIDEKFDKGFLHINTMDKLDSLITNQFRSSNNDTAKTVLFIDSFLRGRFYHTFSRLSLQDNWICWLASKLFWEHFVFPVVPEEIIRHPMAACSQQGIIFQQQLAKLHIRCSTIQFFPSNKTKPGHYAVSVYYDNSWHFYDSNREPYIIDSTMPSIERIIDGKLYEKMYSRPSNVEYQAFFKNKSYKQVNMEPFSKGKMHYLQNITSFLSDWLWLLLLLAYAACFLRNRRSPAH